MPGSPPPATIFPEAISPAVCFAPGTPPEVVEAFYTKRGPAAFELYRLGNRWSSTATNGSGLQQGDPTTITWSILPDGTNIPGGDFGAGEPSAPSNLRAFLNGIYGNEATWLPLFEQMFDRYSELTGLRYVYQPSDDGAGFPGSGGVLGVRGDVRIGGHFIDDDGGVLAYNFFPNTGDMVIDTADNFYENILGNSIRLRNVLAHEHGHGVGLSHSCPTDGTKLMEPFVNLNFDGPQLDDQLGGNRGYGDRFENNNTSGAAASLGGPLALGDYSLLDLSIDDNADVDFYRFSVNGSNKSATIVIQPVGMTYLEGPQNQNGSCSAGTNFNALAINDLGVEVRDSDGVTVLASANFNPAGQSETLTSIPLPSGSGPYFIRVFGGSADNAQLYRMEIEIASTVDGPVLQANGSSLVAENCAPANSVIDPGETVTVSYTLRNIGNVGTSNLVATLQSSAGVLSPSGPQNYGAIAQGASATREFTFTAVGNCGSTVTATLQLQDGATDLGIVSFDFMLGELVNTTTSFTNTGNISIPVFGVASPYPSTINVAGVTDPVTKVTVTLNNLTHSWLADMDVLLVGPAGQELMLMSDAGTDQGGTSVNNVTLTFSDTASSGLPQSNTVASGTYRPTDFLPGENLPAPAPPGPYSAALSVFNGANPNGTWRLYLADDTDLDGGMLAGGWTLNITSTVTVCCELPDLRIGSITRLENGNIEVTGSGIPNQPHTIQISDDLDFTETDPTETVIANAAGLLEFEDENATGSQRFYRFRYP